MTYKINGHPITKLTRVRALNMLEAMDKKCIETRERASEFYLIRQNRDDLLLRLGIAEGELGDARQGCVNAEAELSDARERRDAYKKESIDNWLKLTAAETTISRHEATIACMKRDLRWRWSPRDTLILVGLVVAATSCAGYLAWH